MLYTYIIFDPEDHTPRYVGKGSGNRIEESYTKTHNVKLREMLSHRSRREFLIIDAPSEASAFAMEIFWIATFGREDLDKGPLFNLTDGGDGVSYSPELSKRVSQIMSAKWQDPSFRAERSAQLKLAQNRESTREKISKAMTGKPSPRRKKCTIDGGVTVYNSFKELCSVISRWHAKRHPQFQWVDEEE